MKAVLSFVFFLAVTFSYAQTPVAYYPFSGNANDAVGTLNGTVNGGASLTTDRFGNANSAYSFDGVDDNISINNSAALNFTNYTISLWFKYNGAGTSGKSIWSLISKNNNGNGFDDAFHIWVASSDKTTGGRAGNGVNEFYVGGLPAIDNGAWHQSVLVFDNANNLVKFYLDGVLISSVANNSNPFNNGGDVKIGFWEAYNNFFNGAIDEVKIYNVALTASQVLVEYAASNHVQKPGSGNAISFDGTDDFIGAASQQLIAVNSFTMEAWVKPDKVITLHPQSTSGTAGTGGINSYLFFPSNGTLDIPVANSAGAGISVGTNGVCVMEHSVGYLPALLSWSGTIFGWTHIAVVYTNKQPSLYVNGVLVATGLTSTATNIYASNYNSGYPGAYGMYSGLADELRIWDVSLTSSQIKDRMCKKITGSDALFADLIVYSNFDESSGTVAFDGTSNQLNYNLVNGPARVTSGAAIGNASAHDYVNATKTVSLAHASGENFTVTSSSGNPDGIQVYRVDEQPNTLTGASGVGANDKYFGVFQVNGTTPQYTAVYNYNGNPGVNAGNENTLALFKRNDNAVTIWANSSAALNTTTKTLTVTGQSTEYILGNTGAALPVNFLSFTGTKQNNNALLQWKTANEINVARYEVQRSINGQQFITVGSKNAGGVNYLFEDADAFVTQQKLFYRLKSVDKDGRFSYSGIVLLQANAGSDVLVFPNPVITNVTVANLKQNSVVRIINAAGSVVRQQNVTAQSVTINMQSLAAGIYLLQYQNNVTGTLETVKIIKQ